MKRTESEHALVVTYGCEKCATRCLTLGSGDRAGRCPQSFCDGAIVVDLVAKTTFIGAMKTEGEG